MGLAEESKCCGHEFAKRFLQTAVVVDDEAYMGTGSNGPKGEVVVPDRRTPTLSQEDHSSVGSRSKHSLDAQSVMDSFAALGVICGVVGPTQSAMETMRKADIVVLDWRLQKDDPRYALKLLRDLLAGEELDRNSLRLVAIYTGEARLENIYDEIIAELEKNKLESIKIENGNKAEILYRHSRVVLYAKSGVKLAKPLKQRRVEAEDLPKRLVDDFTAMTEGLLPSIALTSLTAVREGAHKVLDRFCAELDPAFLTQKACISNPDDAELQIVSHVAEELRGLMDNAVAEQSPAGAKAVEAWLRRKHAQGNGDKNFSLKDMIKLANEGLGKSSLNEKYVKKLSAGFAGGNAVELNKRLAWIMSFRTVFNAPPPTLWLGSVVTKMGNGKDDGHLICMRPRCDCVRLEGDTRFFFLPLVEPKKRSDQLVVRLDNEYKHLSIEPDPAGWVHLEFAPSKNNHPVTATKLESKDGFEFTDTCDKRYTWQGELTTEYAQRIVQNFATKLSRVAVNESEWLRIMAKG